MSERKAGGRFCNEVLLVDAHVNSFAAFLSMQGRVIAFLLVLPQAIAEKATNMATFIYFMIYNLMLTSTKLAVLIWTDSTFSAAGASMDWLFVFKNCRKFHEVICCGQVLQLVNPDRGLARMGSRLSGRKASSRPSDKLGYPCPEPIFGNKIDPLMYLKPVGYGSHHLIGHHFDSP